ncbi:uncharacterized protein METZ01_LOCUS31710 [marine metagenome]|uniref:DUF962 domain-containing protein n=1 Tax=marine metagenome TaxID=408172 RepID=A0A381QHQ5_9ZZZZ
MIANSKLMEMLVGYSGSHQHPINIAFHLIGIPVIMFGIFIPLSWISFNILGIPITLAHLTVVGFFLFYLTLDTLFALVFLVIGIIIAQFSSAIGLQPTSGSIALIAFFGGYVLQFVGHAIEKTIPVLIRHPIQAHLAAPFFVIVEIFGLLHLREELFLKVNKIVTERRKNEAL